MKKYKTLIKKLHFNKYKDSTIKKKNFINLFVKSREIFLEEIKKMSPQSENIDRYDKTFHELSDIYNKKKTSKNNIILAYYKKFEINLSLKKMYNQNLKKISNYETDINTYIYLGLLLSKLTGLTKLHKLNCVLKILDKIFLKKREKKPLNFKKLILLLNWEKKTILTLLNEK
tara:strand:- start:2919 stop:3437 length:519 start_codon:yes stop_codon:yes gene_type:complete